MLALINQWLGVLALAMGIANGLWIWLSRPARELKAELEKRDDEIEARCDRHREDLKEHDRRIQRVEDNLRHLPTKDDLSKVGEAMASMKTELDMVARTVTRIDDHLRKQP